jgi:hypothetical protein
MMDRGVSMVMQLVIQAVYRARVRVRVRVRVEIRADKLEREVSERWGCHPGVHQRLDTWVMTSQRGEASLAASPSVSSHVDERAAGPETRSWSDHEDQVGKLAALIISGSVSLCPVKATSREAALARAWCACWREERRREPRDGAEG